MKCAGWFEFLVLAVLVGAISFTTGYMIGTFIRCAGHACRIGYLP